MIRFIDGPLTNQTYVGGNPPHFLDEQGNNIEDHWNYHGDYFYALCQGKETGSHWYEQVIIRETP